ncbi:MAG: HAD family hydrolase [Lachnospiraceae bacterium]|nr:HAD family hydrolase [Lachnospiraceae bacterium]MDY4971035.1 HAD family hydrolase [Lachnospiraceae bacterium]
MAAGKKEQQGLRSQQFNEGRRKECRIRLIALDLDGTTLDGEGNLTPENRMALEEAAEKGVYVVVASGRALSTLPKEVMELSCISYAITSNGAAICSMPDQALLRRYLIPEKAVEQVVALADAYFAEYTGFKRLNYEVFVDGVAFAQADYVADAMKFGGTENERKYILESRRPVDDIHAFIRRHRRELDSMDLIIHDPEKKEKMWELLKQQVPGIYITSSVPRLLEISSKECGKWSGICHLLEILGLSPEEVITFGDARNDLDMIRGAGIGVAMSNAHPILIDSADYVTGSNEESGVAQALRALGVI